MPGSDPRLKREVSRRVVRAAWEGIVDVGPGAGVWADLLGHGRLDCIEVHEPYVERFNLRAKYREVIVADVRDVDLSRWRYAILGDVLEHLPVADAQRLVESATAAGVKLLVAVPYLSPQPPVEGNKHEEHLQADLDPTVMRARYPDLRCIGAAGSYAYWVNYEEEPVTPDPESTGVVPVAVDPDAVPVYWWDGSTRGYWDQALLEAAVDGTLYRTPRPYRYRHVTAARDLGASGCVAVIPGSLVGDERLRGFVDARSWALLICGAGGFGAGSWAPAQVQHSIIWVQNQTQETSGELRSVDRLVPMGWRHDTRAVGASLSWPSPWPRRVAWSFSGQPNSDRRRACMRALRALDHTGVLNVTTGIGDGAPYPEYLSLLAETHIAPCPPGSHVPDTARTWEALEMGCLPVADGRSDLHEYEPDYYAGVALDSSDPPPFPRVLAWEEFPEIVERYRHAPLDLLRDTNRAFAWWQREKRRFVCRLEDDVFRVSGQRPPPAPGLRGEVTVLIPTSPIPSHPSTAIVEETLRRVRSYPELAECEVLLMIDGIRSEQAERAADYEEYKRRLLVLCNWHPDWRGVCPIVFDDHRHQAAMAREALRHVRTPHIFYVEHDTWPTGEVPFEKIVRGALADESVDVVRLHIFDRIIEEHRHLYKEPTSVGGVPLVATRAWSQRPHLASTEWYREMIDREFHPDDRGMIEDRIYGTVEELGFASPWQVWVYSPDGSMVRSGTTDGRDLDPKYESIYVK